MSEITGNRPQLTVHYPRQGGRKTTPEGRRARLDRQDAAARAIRLQEQHAAVVRFHSGKRRAAKLRRTPAWADLQAIRAIYAEARRLTTVTGIPHHVDHEIPLQGELVSGLHVHNNLQILTGSENSRKKNRYEIEP